MNKQKIQDIDTPIDFQTQYLNSTDSYVCPFCYEDSTTNKTGFLQIAQNTPVDPSMKPIGKNTADITKVMETIAPVISPIALRVANLGGR